MSDGPEPERHAVQSAAVVLPCADLDATVAFFTGQLGFRLDSVFPADQPAVAIISGHGLRIRLQRGDGLAPGVLRLGCRDQGARAGTATQLTAPNGTRIELVAEQAPLALPPLRPSFVVTPMDDATGWHTGRAGMEYRDLIPDRQGGRFVASHIRITASGAVPDYVHFHRVRLQLIYCHRGWVRVVYQDQGPPFVLRAGDCVLQPPGIRHRVLESSPGLEVLELSSPAEHPTLVDHDLLLPTAVVRPEGVFDGQHFVHHRAAGAAWRPWERPGFEARDLGIAAATEGLADAHVVRCRGTASPEMGSHQAELEWLYLLAGAVTLRSTAHGDTPLRAGDSVVVPAGLPHALCDPSAELELLAVTVHG